MEVTSAERPFLVATFNSGFKLSDDHSGFILNGRTYAPMREGQATLVGYTNGSVDVIDWRYGPRAPANVAFARQNLPLIVNEGAPAANVANSGEWGTTVGNAALVWRSGIGIDRHGDLIYAAGEDQTVSSLAQALIRAGTTRAMELDINSYWVSFITYGAADAGLPQNLLPRMERPATRYLEPDDRDFFAVYAR
jgi:phosphodiester glycosidase